MMEPSGDQTARAVPSPPPLRRTQGKALREGLKRADQGLWKAAADRPEPIKVLKAAVAHRDPTLLPIRWGRMARSPFNFFRGNAALMAADLAHWPTTGLHGQLCGDAHVMNFGAFGKHDGSLVFDLNDFDETCRGPIFEKARRDTPKKLLEKAIEPGPRFRTKGPFLRPLSDEEATPFLSSFAEYHDTLGPARQQVLGGFQPACFEHRVAGCGSLGVMDVLVLAFGNGPNDPIF